MQIGLGISPTINLAVQAAIGPTDGFLWDTAADYVVWDTGTDYLIWQ